MIMLGRGWLAAWPASTRSLPQDVPIELTMVADDTPAPVDTPDKRPTHRHRADAGHAAPARGDPASVYGQKLDTLIGSSRSNCSANLQDEETAIAFARKGDADVEAAPTNDINS